MPDWEALYQQGDTGWDRGEVSPALRHYLEAGVFEGVKSVLVPGCGRGYEVVELAKRGFDVTALDLAPSAITYLQQALKDTGVQAETVCTDMFSYDKPQAFDIVYEQTCLCAIEPAQRQAYADVVYDWLKPSGKLLLNMMQTGEAGGPPFHCDFMEMKALFSSDKWIWQEQPPLMIPRGKGRVSPRFELGYVLEKKEVSHA